MKPYIEIFDFREGDSVMTGIYIDYFDMQELEHGLDFRLHLAGTQHETFVTQESLEKHLGMRLKSSEWYRAKEASLKNKWREEYEEYN